ncbi:MAG TPA: TonB-dependent receptor [Bacteroidetes bacterium]|nr:TonB-dependent receptor [Bacteroidota bacterium]
MCVYICTVFKYVLILTIWINKATAQGLQGTVLSEGKPVSYANIGIEGTTNGAIADENGKYLIPNLQNGNYKIKCSAIGFYTVSKKVIVSGNTMLNINMQANENALKDVVVSGTMKEVSRQNSPVSVEIYTPKFFLKNPTANMFDALQMVNGVQPTLNCNVCNTGDIHINGMEGPYTMVMIDGMPIVSALSGVYGLSGIPNSMIERIEIVKGPASTLYGSEAVAGLINVITKKPERAPQLSVDVFGTSYNEYNLDAAVKFKVGKANSLLSTNAFWFDTKWDKNNDNFTDITLQKRVSVFNKWSFERKFNREANIGIRYMTEDRWGGEMNWAKNWRGTDSVYGESIYTKRFELIGNYQLPVNEKIKLMYSLIDHRQNSYYGVTSFNATQTVGFGQLVWDKKLSHRHDLLFGAGLRYTYYDDNTTATQKGDSVNIQNNASYTALPGIFVQDEIDITASQKLLLGVRYDYYKQHGSIVSPRVNYKWSPNPYNTIRLSAGNGFRVVSIFTEDHAALTGARNVEIKEALKPEQSWNVNLNYTKHINLKKGFILFDATAFFTYFSNRIIADYDSDPNKIIYDNLNGYAVSRGISLNTEYAFTFPLKINAGITAMQVFKVENDSLGKQQTSTQIHAPNWSGTFQVTYTINRYNLTIDLTGQVYGPMRLPILPNDFRPEYSPWFSLQNIQLTQKINPRLQVYGGVKNIFNFVPQNPIMRPFDPFDKQVTINNPNGYTFDPSYNYAPLQGIRVFMGIRYVLGQ